MSLLFSLSQRVARKERSRLRVFSATTYRMTSHRIGTVFRDWELCDSEPRIPLSLHTGYLLNIISIGGTTPVESVETEGAVVQYLLRINVIWNK
ncbi:MAG: hypothetical protein WAW36_11755 [Methylovulum miyakonense]|uniref:hypothetical protein n=1 Tax=Methylovulum miyakonense TaxID=645578 RepID=UPI003BB4B917